MSRFNSKNIDRKTNKPSPKRTEGLTDDQTLNRAEQVRRDDDVIRTPKRTIYDIDYAIKWYLDNEIQPQVRQQQELINVPVIFASGEKWDNVQRLGYIRDEKGMLQSPVIMIKRNSVTERDQLKNLDVNRTHPDSKLVYRNKYNARNRYDDILFPMPTNQRVPSQEMYIIDIPKYVTVSYDLLLWCDFTTQMNDVVDQILPYNRFEWGNESNRFATFIETVNFETVNTVGEDRLVRATIPLTVNGTLLSGQESRISTIQKMYSVKKVRFDTVVADLSLFSSTNVPDLILQNGGGTIIIDEETSIQITPEIMNYLVNLTDKIATYVSGTTVTVNALAAINPVTSTVATVNEFDVYINGQYIDKQVYTWTPSDISTQTIVFNTGILGYSILPTDVVVIRGRWQ